jgi:hemerythrin
MIDINEIPLVSFDEINTVHIEEVELLNKLYTLLDANEKEEKKILLTLNELLLHVREHFANEERLMKESYYPSLSMHKAEHGKIINEMQMQIILFRNRKDYELLREYFEEEIPTWLNQHIKSMDIILAEFLTQRS